ncbi:MAG: winged helix-turn-helix transcriptional regulator [Coriobacteriaceae bacterium]
MLNANLEALGKGQLVHREEYPQTPPKVEYSLTARRKPLIQILDACAIGERSTSFSASVMSLCVNDVQFLSHF